MKLSEILDRNGSDKCKRHTYQFLYDAFEYDRETPLDILESGVEYGPSLVAWKEFYPNAKVTGVDIVDMRKPEFKQADVEFVLSDIKQYQPDRKFDIIIEDGNHSNNDAIWAGVNLSKWLKPNGTLIIEDVQEGYIVPFILWGQLHGNYIVETVDMRRLTNTHDNFLILIKAV